MNRPDQSAEASVRKLARYGFANRWAQYFPIVFGEWLARPQALGGLRDAIVRQEERLAEEEVRPRLAAVAPDRDRVAADCRARDSEGLTRALAEGFGLSDSIDAFRTDVRNEIQSAVTSAGGSDEQSYPLYVMALDRAVAFEEAASTILAAHASIQRPDSDQAMYAEPAPEDIDPFFEPEPEPPPPGDDIGGDIADDIAEVISGAGARPARSRSGRKWFAVAAAGLLAVGGVGALAAWYADLLPTASLNNITADISFPALPGLTGPSAELGQAVSTFLEEKHAMCSPFVGPLLVVHSTEFRRCVKGDDDDKFKALDDMVALAGAKWLDVSLRTFDAASESERQLIQSAVDHDKARRKNQFRIWSILRDKEKSREPAASRAVSTDDTVHFFGLVSCVCDKAARMKNAKAGERRKRVFISEMVTQEQRKRSHAQLFLLAMPDHLDRFAREKTPKDVKVLLFSKKTEAEAQRQRRSQIERYKSAGYRVTILSGTQ